MLAGIVQGSQETNLCDRRLTLFREIPELFGVPSGLEPSPKKSRALAMNRRNSEMLCDSF